MKTKFAFTCSECGYSSPQWLGRCPDCGQFNTLVEEVSEQQKNPYALFSNNKAVAINKIQSKSISRTKSGIGEFDRLLGGGIVDASLVLIGGSPGIGKSTLLLQLAVALAQKDKKVLIASGEESSEQTKLRADRLAGSNQNNLFILAENNLSVIEKETEEIKADVLIVDSIQTMFSPIISSAPGSVSQVRECTANLMKIAKGKNTVVFIVGHVTKEGALAGPRVLEHMVDTVLYFEGDAYHNYRIIRAVKNRFGSTNEVAVFEMNQAGLEEITNPSELFLSGRANASGSVITATAEGSRPLLVEIQALTCNSNYANPRRQTSGVDYNRLAIILAVLEKRAGLSLADKDVYVNVAGGLKIEEASADLAIALAISSNLKDNELIADTVVFGEIGLSGEIRQVNNLEIRLKEAIKLGFKKAILPRSQIKVSGIKLQEVENINQALEYLG